MRRRGRTGSRSAGGDLGPAAGRATDAGARRTRLTLQRGRPEEPAGTVLNDVAQYASQYSPKNWDVRMRRAPVVIDFAEHGLAARDLMLGVEAFGASRAYLYDAVLREKLVKDYVGGQPVLLVVGADGESVRAFRNGAGDFYRLTDGDGLLMDSASGSRWNFQGCAVEGKSKGVCLERVPVIKDYWFDWRNYHPAGTVWGK